MSDAREIARIVIIQLGVKLTRSIVESMMSFRTMRRSQIRTSGMPRPMACTETILVATWITINLAMTDTASSTSKSIFDGIIGISFPKNNYFCHC